MGWGDGGEKDGRNACVSLLFFNTPLPPTLFYFFPLSAPPPPKGTPKKPTGIDSARDVVPWFLCDLCYESLQRGAPGAHQPERLLTFFQKRPGRQNSQVIYRMIFLSRKLSANQSSVKSSPKGYFHNDVSLNYGQSPLLFFSSLLLLFFTLPRHQNPFPSFLLSCLNLPIPPRCINNSLNLHMKTAN